MLESSALLIFLLAWERHADGLAAPAITVDPFVFPSQEIPLITASMALAVGEPKRALRTLEEIDAPGEIAEAVAALRYAAEPSADGHEVRPSPRCPFPAAAVGGVRCW